MNTARGGLAGAGTQTLAVAFGGIPAKANTEEYNGTSWTSVNSMNTARGGLGGAGIQNNALAFGGGHLYQQVQQNNMMEQLGILQHLYPLQDVECLIWVLLQQQ
jgi:hypothetical protein